MKAALCFDMGKSGIFFFLVEFINVGRIYKQQFRKKQYVGRSEEAITFRVGWEDENCGTEK